MKYELSENTFFVFHYLRSLTKTSFRQNIFLDTILLRKSGPGRIRYRGYTALLPAATMKALVLSDLLGAINQSRAFVSMVLKTAPVWDSYPGLPYTNTHTHTYTHTQTVYLQSTTEYIFRNLWKIKKNVLNIPLSCLLTSSYKSSFMYSINGQL